MRELDPLPERLVNWEVDKSSKCAEMKFSFITKPSEVVGPFFSPLFEDLIDELARFFISRVHDARTANHSSMRMKMYVPVPPSTLEEAKEDYDNFLAILDKYILLLSEESEGSASGRTSPEDATSHVHTSVRSRGSQDLAQSPSSSKRSLKRKSSMELAEVADVQGTPPKKTRSSLSRAPPAPSS